MLNETMIPEIRHEGTQTRKMLERVPFDQFSWKPHDKSNSLGRLAVHIAEIPLWTARILENSEFDLANRNYQPAPVTSTEDIVALLDKNIGVAIASLEKASDEDLKASWTVKRGTHVVFSSPRAAAIRNMAMNHLIHHRAQLSVYLRLLNVAIPGMYGPSADDLAG
jgi:uncharacterized damage-inducible protein DinB